MAGLEMGTPRAGFPLLPLPSSVGFPLGSLIAKRDLDDQMLADNVAQILLPFCKLHAALVQRPNPILPSAGGGDPIEHGWKEDRAARVRKTKQNMGKLLQPGHVCRAPCGF